MEYTIITPIDKAVAVAASQSTGDFPWELLIIGVIALAVLVALAVHEYDKRQLEDAYLLSE